MAKMSCFSALLGGRRQKPVDQVADAKTKQGGGPRPRVKPVEFIHAPPVLVTAPGPAVEKYGDKAAPCDGADVVAVKPHKSGGIDTSPVKKDKLSDTDVHRAVIAEEEAADDPSAKLKRSCSNIDTKRAGPRGAMPARRSRSYGDLQPGPGGVVSAEATPGPEGSPASVKTADRVMLKKRSSSQVLPSRSRKLWWRLFLWSHRNLHRPRSGRPGDAGRYTSDTLDGAGQRRRRRDAEARHGPPPPARLPQQAAAQAAARAGGGHGQRRAGRSTRRRALRRLSHSPGASTSRSGSKDRHHLGSSLTLTARK